MSRDNIRPFPPKAPKAARAPKNHDWNHEVEQATLAALLLDKATWEQVAAIVTDEDFSDTQHRQIFRAMAGLAKQDKSIDTFTVSAAVPEVQGDDELRKYIKTLAGDTSFSTDHVADYAKHVRKYSLERQCSAAAEKADWERIAALNEQIRQLEEASSAHSSGKLGAAVLTVQELRGMALPKCKLLNDIIIEGAQGLLYADAGLGKTYFALTLAAATAAGKPFMKWATYEAVEVLYVDGEMLLQAMQERLKQLMPEDVGKPIHLLSHEWFFRQDKQNDLRLCDPRQQAELLAYLDEHPGIKLVILDNLSCLFPGADEDKRDSWVRLVQPLMLWMRRRGIACLLLHHTGKGGSQRGSSAREGMLDLMIKLERPDNWSPEDGAHFVVAVKKGRLLQGSVVKSFEAALDYGPDKKPAWTVQQPMPPKLKALVAFLQEHGPLTVLEIARKQHPAVEVDYQSKEFNATRRLVYRARDDGLIEQRHFDGQWWVPLDKQISRKAASPNADGPPDEAYLEDLAMIQAREDDQVIDLIDIYSN